MALLANAAGPILAPRHVMVVGGGRWARVILDVLCELLPQEVRLEVHTHAQAAMTEWSARHPRRRRIAAAAVFPAAPGGAVIVANAVQDHAAAAAAALRAGSFVLLEKPLAPDYESARALTDLAANQGHRLAAAQVLLFAVYLDNFSQLVAGTGRVESIEFTWTDPVTEHRYGEVKAYDPGVPVFGDWLPHALPVLGMFLPRLPDSVRLTSLRDGGAAVDLALEGAGVPCAVCFARLSDRRRRILRVRTAGGVYAIDFSVEPGTLTAGGVARNADPSWAVRPGPLTQLLAAFLTWAGGGPRDPRLDPAVGLRSCAVVRQIDTAYRPQVESWLAGQLATGTPLAPAARYALTELLQRQGRWSAGEVGAQVAALAGVGEVQCAWPEALTGQSATAQFLRAFVSENLPS